MFIESFWLRVLLLLAVFAVIALLDYCLNKKSLRKLKEYSFIIGSGAAFALIGAIHNQITVTISPEYYALGKELGYDSLRILVLQSGLKTGMYAGVIFGCVFLFVNKCINWQQLINWLKFVAVSSAVFLIIGSVSGYLLHTSKVELLASSVLNVQVLVVLGWHIGLYAGAISGMMFLAIDKYFSYKTRL